MAAAAAVTFRRLGGRRSAARLSGPSGLFSVCVPSARDLGGKGASDEAAGQVASESSGY